jgi:hypothetical protein
MQSQLSPRALQSFTRILTTRKQSIHGSIIRSQSIDCASYRICHRPNRRRIANKQAIYARQTKSFQGVAEKVIWITDLSPTLSVLLAIIHAASARIGAGRSVERRG